MTNNVNKYSIELYQAPESEPITLDEVKTFLRIDGDSENDSISIMISAARMAAEKYMRNSIISQKWKLSFDEITNCKVSLPYGPVTAIDSVNLISTSGESTEFSDTNYYLTAGNRSIYFSQIPNGRRVEIIFSTGMAEDATTVSALIKQGLLAHIAFMYERKQLDVEPGSTAKSLYNFYRNIGI